MKCLTAPLVHSTTPPKPKAVPVTAGGGMHYWRRIEFGEAPRESARDFL